ncbi:MAG: hypothetical protein J2P58_04170 [Acidimicrobiaceae bacterium]|nr:hypothetical protein [Acidimicrobiaceae bacterium]
MTATVDAELDFDCPRCGRPTTERFYGPCTSCRQEMVTTFTTGGSAGEAEVATARFEPGMHVVPNHVATKD